MTINAIAPSMCAQVAPTATPLPLSSVYVELPRIELKGMSWEGFQHAQKQHPELSEEQQQQMLKDYVWKHCQDQLLQGLRIETGAAAPNNYSTKLTSKRSITMPSLHDTLFSNTVHTLRTVVKASSAAQHAESMPSPLFPTWPHVDKDTNDITSQQPQQQQQQQQPCCDCFEKLQQVELVNAELTQEREQAVRRSQAQLQHFASASHEIRTPLNCIIGLTSLLQTTELNPLQAESMQLISTSSELLLTVVNDVLDYSKLESGHVDVKLKPANLQETFASVVQAMELKNHDSSIRVRTQYSPQLPPTWTTDRLRLQQILFNLLGNAFKFSPSDSCVDLKVEIGPPGTPSVPSHVAKPITSPCVLRFVVKDYGCGIAPAALEEIFQPFVQAGEDTAKLYEGTGLGLAISHKLVQALGGCVYAHSTVHVGSEFVVEFPFDQADIFDVRALGDKLTNVTCLIVPGPNLPAPPILKELLEPYQISYRILDSMEDLDGISLLHDAQSSSVAGAGDESMSLDDSLSVPVQQCHDEGDSMIVLPADHTYVCWIDESVYRRDIMQRFQTEVDHAETKSLLWTVGPDYTVVESSHHVRNLLQIVPSVLMHKLSAAVEDIIAVPQLPVLKPKSLFRASSFGSSYSWKNVPLPTTPLNRASSVESSVNGHKHLRRKASLLNSKKKQKGMPLRATSLFLPATATRDKEDISILIVEDNIINQKVLRALLKKLGYTRVSVVGDGQMAVDAVEHGVFDVVLMDVQMPVMNGLEATRVIVGRHKEEGCKRQQPKIVFVTATVDQSLEEEAKELGAFGFVPKPFSLKQLESCMTDICRSMC